MRAYVEFAKKSFQNCIAFRINTIFGIINAIITIFVFVAVWTSVYSSKKYIDGIEFSKITTYFILGVALSNIFSVNEQRIASKVYSGNISSEIMKPVSFRGLVLSQEIGELIYRIIIQLFPTMLLSVFFIGILPPASGTMFILTLVSIFLGYLIYYFIGFITAISSFWFINIWGISILKNVLISVFSGVMFPIWFMPFWFQNIIKYTPFDSIYYIPISIYLNRFDTYELFFYISKQFIWLLVLFLLTNFIWERAKFKLTVNGG